LSAQHRQEAEVAAVEERERAAAETAATAARAARPTMMELAAARAEVEAAAVADAACAAAAELKALRASSTDSSISADDDRDNELKLAREAAWEQAPQWAATHPQGRRGGSPDGRERAGDAPGRGARGGRVPDGGGNPDRRGCAGGWVDGDHSLYRRHDSLSPDRYHGHHGIQAIVRDISPDGGWPTLTRTNYVEWAAVMRVRLQVRHMWEAVRYGDVDYYEDRRALDALIATVPSEMQFSLSKKRTAKEAWDAIAVARIGSDRARKTTLQALRKEWENLAFKPSEDVDDFALRLNTLQQKMVQFGDGTYGEEKAVEKLFRCIPEKYKQITRSIKSLLDLSTMSIEEVIGRLKVIDGDEQQPLSGSITIGGKLHLTREQWEACQGDGKKGESPPPQRAAASAASDTSHAEAPKPGRNDVSRVAPAEAPAAVPPATRSRHETAPATTVASLAIGPRSADCHDAARPMSHRWRRRSQLCSWHMQASSYLQRHWPQRLSFTLMSREHTPSSATAPAVTRLTGGTSTPVPPIT
jgi:hypothetical protein